MVIIGNTSTFVIYPIRQCYDFTFKVLQLIKKLERKRECTLLHLPSFAMSSAFYYFLKSQVSIWYHFSSVPKLPLALFVLQVCLWQNFLDFFCLKMPLFCLHSWIIFLLNINFWSDRFVCFFPFSTLRIIFHLAFMFQRGI